MRTTLRHTPYYFVIDSIGGMYEGYSETDCKFIRDTHMPELGKAMAEEYMDQWMHDMVEYYTNRAEELEIPMLDVKFEHTASARGNWHKVQVDLGKVDYDEFESCHTLFIAAGDNVDTQSVLMYNQMEDMIESIFPYDQAVRNAEEMVSLYARRIQAKLRCPSNTGGWDQHYAHQISYAYDCLSEVIKDLHDGQDVMVDIDDCCVHYMPVKRMKRLMYDAQDRIVSQPQ